MTDLPSDLKELLEKKEIYLPIGDIQNLIKGKESNFTFITENSKKVAVKLKLNPNYLKGKTTSVNETFFILKPTQNLFISKSIQEKFDENPQLLDELLKHKFVKTTFALSTDKVQDFYLRIHPYLNRVEAYPVAQVAVPQKFQNFIIHPEMVSQIQHGEKLNFKIDREEFSLKFDPLNKRFKIHLAETFEEKHLNFPVTKDTPTGAKAIFMFIAFDKPERPFSIEITPEFHDFYTETFKKDLMVSDLIAYMKNNNFLSGVFPQFSELDKAALFDQDAPFKVEKPLNEFENHYQVSISTRMFLTHSKDNIFLQNEAIYYACQTFNKYSTERKIESNELLPGVSNVLQSGNNVTPGVKGLSAAPDKNEVKPPRRHKN